MNIAPVDLDYAAIHFLGVVASYDEGIEFIHVWADFNSASQVQVTVYCHPGAAAQTYRFEVIEFYPEAVEPLQKLTTGGVQTIREVKLDKTFSVFGHRGGSGSASVLISVGYIQDATHVYVVSKPSWIVEGK